MITYYKAVRPDGTDFHSASFVWVPADGIPKGGWLVTHPNPGERIGRRSGADASQYLSVATVPTDCTGFRWPCRLIQVQAVGRAFLDGKYPNKRRVRAARVIAELPAWQALGPQGEQVAALIVRVQTLTGDELDCLDAAWDAAGDAAGDAALALITRDLITTAQYAALTLPWRQTVGRIHPDDPEELA